MIDAGEITWPNTELFTPLSKTENGLLLVSPSSMLRKNYTYDDQVLEGQPFAAELNIERIELLFEREIITDGPIVEIGCGTGVLVRELRAAGRQAHGIEMLDEYGSKWREYNVDKWCYVGNVEDIPGVNSNSFALVTTRAFWDSAFGTGGKGGLNDPEKCMREISRVLRPSGVFLAMSDNENHFPRLTTLAREFGLSELRADNLLGNYDIAYLKK
jgi:SAM-dependent methyltransferase